MKKAPLGRGATKGSYRRRKPYRANILAPGGTVTHPMLYARAVAYEASRDDRHYRDLRHEEREAFWTHVNNLRNQRELARVRSRFWLDQEAHA